MATVALQQTHFIYCLCPKNALSTEFRERTPSLFPLASELPRIVPPEDELLLQRLDNQWRMFPMFKK